MQTPFWHFSPVVHALPSLQLVPFFEASDTHVPVSGLHLRHWPQLTLAGPWVHVPFWQVSFVQRLPVSHGVLLAKLVCTQPVAGLHVSIVQGLLSSQSTGSPPAQTPAAVHVSFFVQALPSLQEFPTWLGSGTHVPVS